MGEYNSEKKIRYRAIFVAKGTSYVYAYTLTNSLETRHTTLRFLRINYF